MYVRHQLTPAANTIGLGANFRFETTNDDDSELASITMMRFAARRDKITFVDQTSFVQLIEIKSEN